MRRPAAALIVALLAAGRSEANMTIAAQAAGGLVPVRAEEIGIESEDLFISRKLVRVRYAFRNLTDKDVSAPVLFPLPEIDVRAHSDDSYTLPISYTQEPPVLDVRVQVAGKPVQVGWQQRAFSRTEEDVTERLRAAKLPLLAVGNLTEAVRALPDGVLAEFVRDGILVKEGEYFSPNWVLRGAFRWEQSFPGAAITAVEVEYQPLTGLQAFYGAVDPKTPPARLERSLLMRDAKRELAPWHEEYCLTAQHVRELAKIAVQPDDLTVDIGWTRYILVTALNWNGPIRRFRLTVDKIRPEAVVAFCSPVENGRIRQVSPTTYEVEAADFSPQRNFQMITLSPAE